MLRQVAAAEQLPDEFDAGYRILLDKDGLTEGMKPPTYQAYIPRRPAESKYIEMIENFFLETGYTAKYLWRDDPMAAKFILDTCMKLEHLLPMLEWHVECAHNWSLKTGPHGRGMKKWLRPDLWAQLEATYSGAGLEENWETLDRMIVLMRTVALEVGQCLGYVYPEEIEQRARVYIEQVKNMPRDTQPGPGLNTWK
jgi:aminoglycoside 6-adenylyltransferase